MEIGKDCNLNVYSEKELENFVKKNNYELSNIKKVIDNEKESNFRLWCYYVITN